MTTQLVGNLNVIEAAEALATSTTPQLVNGLTVDELQEVIANVIDARLNIFFNSLNINGSEKPSTVENNKLNLESQTLSFDSYADKSKVNELERNQFLKEYEENVVQARNSLNHVENLLESIVEVKKENPWLKIAGMHKDNPDLFEEVVAYMEASRQEILEEELV